MTDERTTRRAYLGALGTALSIGVAGCSGILGGQNTNTTDSPQTTVNNTSTGNTTASDSSAENTTAEAQSPYTQVYRETIDSVVLLSVTTTTGQSVQGSGFVYQDNYIVTNAHVVSDARNVQVRFSRGQWRSATVVGADPSSDLAVVQVQNPPQYAKALPLVENEPPIGTRVAAIGSPYSLEGSISSGIISAVNRSIPAPNGYTIPDAIQTDAPVNPGNSGGPLLNLDGEVVGVISSGGGENLAFAVSAALMKRVIPALIEDGEYNHAYIGIGRLLTVTPAVAEELGLSRSRGVLVRRVLPNTPAAGTLRRGDIIVGINGKRIDTLQQLSSYLALEASPGDVVEITVRRNGERQTVSLTLAARPEQPGTRTQPTTTPR